MPESRVARADRRTTAFLVRIGEEIRAARIMAGLTLTEASRVAGISRSEASRIERGESPWLAFSTLARCAAVVGLDLWIRAFPGAEPVRDSGHLALADAFRRLVGAPLTVGTEVRIGDRRDLRAWDQTLTDGTGRRCGVELETRFVDAQAQHRRISQKLADSGFDLVLVVVADTRANRAAVRAAAGYLSASMGSTIRRSSKPCEQAASLLARGSSWSPWRDSAPNPAPREQATRKGPREAFFLTQRDTSSMAPVPREDPAFERPSMSTAPVPRESRRNPARVLSEDRAGTRVPSHAATGGPIGSWVPESKERAGDRPARIGY
jgi:transcriptional regulator with XRE-family HTH domain